MNNPADTLAALAGGHLSHEEVANKVRMLMRTDLDHEAVCVIARDRIKWLASRVADLESAVASLKGEAEPRKPDGYAYRYPHHDGDTVIRFTCGQEINGARPIEAVPYFYGTPPAPQATPSPAPQGGGNRRQAVIDAIRRDLDATGAATIRYAELEMLLATPPAQQPGEVGLAWRKREHVGRTELFAPTEPLEHSVGPSGFTVDRPVYDDTFHCVFWHGNRGHMVGKYKSEEAAKAAAGEHLSRLVRALAALAPKEK